MRVFAAINGLILLLLKRDFGSITITLSLFLSSIPDRIPQPCRTFSRKRVLMNTDAVSIPPGREKSIRIATPLLKHSLLFRRIVRGVSRGIILILFIIF